MKEKLCEKEKLIFHNQNEHHLININLLFNFSALLVEEGYKKYEEHFWLRQCGERRRCTDCIEKLRWKHEGDKRRTIKNCMFCMQLVIWCMTILFKLLRCVSATVRTQHSWSNIYLMLSCKQHNYSNKICNKKE